LSSLKRNKILRDYIISGSSPKSVRPLSANSLGEKSGSAFEKKFCIVRNGVNERVELPYVCASGADCGSLMRELFKFNEVTEHKTDIGELK